MNITHSHTSMHVLEIYCIIIKSLMDIDIIKLVLSTPSVDLNLDVVSVLNFSAYSKSTLIGIAEIRIKVQLIFLVTFIPWKLMSLRHIRIEAQNRAEWSPIHQCTYRGY